MNYCIVNPSQLFCFQSDVSQSHNKWKVKHSSVAVGARMLKPSP